MRSWLLCSWLLCSFSMAISHIPGDRTGLQPFNCGIVSTKFSKQKKKKKKKFLELEPATRANTWKSNALTTWPLQYVEV